MPPAKAITELLLNTEARAEKAAGLGFRRAQNGTFRFGLAAGNRRLRLEHGARKDGDDAGQKQAQC
jgi:hypothetical protein